MLKLRKTGRVAIAGLAAVAALSLSACGSDDSKTATTPTKTSTSVTKSNANLPPTPSVADLNAQLLRALDPSRACISASGRQIRGHRGECLR
ncbi:hypothetical protein ACIHDR_06030 [Nocardia sp. NPDC052278]|uniref:hypothetical protein n=1 Tax=unclassified Nocardia TaxID=2637762 RepID=UPI003682160E